MKKHYVFCVKITHLNNFEFEITFKINFYEIKSNFCNTLIKQNMMSIYANYLLKFSY